MKKKVLVISILIVVAAVAFWFWYDHSRDDQPLVLYGNVDIRQVNLAFQWPERIKSLKVQEGDVVTSGQVLAEQETDILKLEIRQAEASVDSAYEAYLELKNGSRPEEIARSKALVDAAMSRQTLAEENYNRVQSIYKKTKGQGISKQEVDDAVSQLSVARNDLVSAQKAYELVKIGPREEAIRRGHAEWQKALANLSLLKLKLEQSELRSPIDATVRNRLLEPGDMASSATPVFTLAINSPKWVRAYINEVNLGKVRPGQHAYVTIDSYPDDKILGQIGFISSVAEFTPKTVETPDLRTNLVYEVRINVEDKMNRLRLGMPATVTFSSEK